MYFEGKSFEEQVTFFSSIDITISTHGAQLTGIPFLESRPLPLFNYRKDLRRFTITLSKTISHSRVFGSLAVAWSLHYGYLYVLERDAELIQPEYLLNRIHTRATNLCPPLLKVVDAVKKPIQDWEMCCGEGA